MTKWHWLFLVLSLAVAGQGCSDDDTNGGGSGGSAGTGGSGGSAGTGGEGGAGGMVTDTDRDGIPDDEDPTPNGSTNNKLNGTNSGGAASVVAITATVGSGEENVDYIYDDDLTTGCDTTWDPQGTLCDEPDTTDSPTTSTKTDYDSGATWYAEPDPGDTAPITGFLVIDACSDDSCEAVDFNEARVFQMYSDGKTTHLRISVHDERGDTPPSWDDAGWMTITDFEMIGAGTSIDDYVVEDPTVISTGPQVTRYVRLEARNDGSLLDDDGSYIEIRSVKLFSVSAPE
ncbi:MAG: hypothetical protein AMJ62_01050 [Myxococcales bacterium SG8_38]|nr:MAG: hypothetical protein AMJ62_01050 [Myxococcales bacterium SG8_38]